MSMYWHYTTSTHLKASWVRVSFQHHKIGPYDTLFQQPLNKLFPHLIHIYMGSNIDSLTSLDEKLYYKQFILIFKSKELLIPFLYSGGCPSHQGCSTLG